MSPTERDAERAANNQAYEQRQQAREERGARNLKNEEEKAARLARAAERAANREINEKKKKFCPAQFPPHIEDLFNYDNDVRRRLREGPTFDLVFVTKDDCKNMVYQNAPIHLFAAYSKVIYEHFTDPASRNTREVRIPLEGASMLALDHIFTWMDRNSCTAMPYCLRTRDKFVDNVSLYRASLLLRITSASTRLWNVVRMHISYSRPLSVGEMSLIMKSFEPNHPLVHHMVRNLEHILYNKTHPDVEEVKKFIAETPVLETKLKNIAREPNDFITKVKMEQELRAQHGRPSNYVPSPDPEKQEQQPEESEQDEDVDFCPTKNGQESEQDHHDERVAPEPGQESQQDYENECIIPEPVPEAEQDHHKEHVTPEQVKEPKQVKTPEHPPTEQEQCLKRDDRVGGCVIPLRKPQDQLKPPKRKQKQKQKQTQKQKQESKSRKTKYETDEEWTKTQQEKFDERRKLASDGQRWLSDTDADAIMGRHKPRQG
ncbi:hypothetical protein M501DRAFT_1017569 [Patellaria atrata CBS 101060]|uniref:Uncharacterized protein n=1 Tax=Patellaria atrata CBS 101060 TaxID=1346257 RepID=A0A9P4VNJ4_9PEZI|nr:hypothetical protein M501DRAFT_1017569 [Patellaria atrata CBS 101060]